MCGHGKACANVIVADVCGESGVADVCEDQNKRSVRVFKRAGLHHVTVFRGGNAMRPTLDKLGKMTYVVVDRRVDQLFLFCVIEDGRVASDAFIFIHQLLGGIGLTASVVERTAPFVEQNIPIAESRGIHCIA